MIISRNKTTLYGAIGLLSLGILCGSVYGWYVNSAPATEKRATRNAHLFVERNHLDATRINCAADIDRDGFGACSIALTSGEVLYLDCPAGYFDSDVLGARNCRELDARLGGNLVRRNP